MPMKLKFNSIKNQSIFQPEFQSFSANGYNVIEFKKQPHAAGGIAVVYAPNGTGKSSLTAVLDNEETREDLSLKQSIMIIVPFSRKQRRFILLEIK